ncbi:hypothetical protein O7623_26285 [Solwaraspora sp. WMMD791]|uniref:hypothetical protein n=1 Tax=Solwaraspora sp. WMMD791 TaxID=3016086 RepID=UPI00249A0B57|nr:hypothetical protein [Solwaraspora sp. WMMD791]WFE26751.1 hypothetical protein O7623_26285 [Solwaraspora sp. WMMD791]
MTSAPSSPPRSRRALRRIAATIALALVSVTGLVGLSAGPAAASWHAASVGSWTPDPGLSLRDCYHPTVKLPPSQDCTFIRHLPRYTSVHVVCQRSGQNIGGNNVWDYVVYSGGEGFVSDYYMNTGHANWIPGIDICT